MEKQIYFSEQDAAVIIAEGFADEQDAQAAVDVFLREKARLDGMHVRLMRLQDSGTEPEEKGKFYFNLTTY